jgi:hypothetical protein
MGRKNKHFERVIAARGPEFAGGEDPRFTRHRRIDRQALLTKERRPNRPILDRFADQLEQDT